MQMILCLSLYLLFKVNESRERKLRMDPPSLPLFFFPSVRQVRLTHFFPHIYVFHSFGGSFVLSFVRSGVFIVLALWLWKHTQAETAY